MPTDLRKIYGQVKIANLGCKYARETYEEEKGYRKPPEKRCQICSGGMKAAQKVCFACGTVQKEGAHESYQV